jgi:ABC-2 type transport system permease protein
VSARRLAVAGVLALRELGRDRMAVFFLFFIPGFFLGITRLITPDLPLLVPLASVEGEPTLFVSQRAAMMTFVAAGVVGFLASFAGMSLVRRASELDRRLALCGYRAPELLLAKLAVLAPVVALVAAFVAALLAAAVSPERPGVMLGGLLLQGLVYGGWGLLVGALLRRELAAVLAITVLANLDAGWLQTPVFYATAENKAFIRALPAFFPCQVTALGAFTDLDAARQALGSAAWGAALFALAVGAFAWRMRTFRHVAARPA